MQRQALLVVDDDLERIAHELRAYFPDTFLECGREHEDLLFSLAFDEYILDIRAHVQRFEHLVTLIDNKVLHMGQVDSFCLAEGKCAARRPYQYHWLLLLEGLRLFFERLPTIHNFNRVLFRVHILQESVKFALDLKS